MFNRELQSLSDSFKKKRSRLSRKKRTQLCDKRNVLKVILTYTYDSFDYIDFARILGIIKVL